jgi:hypothetical protein
MAVTMETRPDLGELRVETGTGIIKKLNAGDRNTQAEIRATHTDLTKPVTGWLDNKDDALLALATKAHADGIEVAYRVEVHRKRSIDKAIPFAELTSDQKVRDLVELTPTSAKSSDETAARGPAPENRAASEAPVAQETPPAPAATDAPAAGAEPPTASEGPEDDSPHPADAPQRPTPTATRRGARIEEARPWELHNTDGSLNLGSYAAQASLGFAELAYRLVVDQDLTARAAGADATPVNMGRVSGLTRTLLRIADRVQAGVRADGRVDRQDASHTRARGVVRLLLDAYPVPWGAERPDQEAWTDQLVAEGVELFNVGIRYVDPDPDLR